MAVLDPRDCFEYPLPFYVVYSGFQQVARPDNSSHSPAANSRQGKMQGFDQLFCGNIKIRPIVLAEIQRKTQSLSWHPS